MRAPHSGKELDKDEGPGFTKRSEQMKERTQKFLDEDKVAA